MQTKPNDRSYLFRAGKICHGKQSTGSGIEDRFQSSLGFILFSERGHFVFMGGGGGGTYPWVGILTRTVCVSPGSGI